MIKKQIGDPVPPVNDRQTGSLHIGIGGGTIQHTHPSTGANFFGLYQAFLKV